MRHILLISIALVPMLAACDRQAPVPERSSGTQGAPAIAATVSKPVVLKTDRQELSDDPDLQGVWKITRVHAMAGNVGQWAEDDDQIVGSLFEWNTPDSVSGALKWQHPENPSFDQRDVCAVPELVPTAPAKGGVRRQTCSTNL
jgi:hypothetical protein